MSETPETYEAVERWQQGKINIFDEMARLERERNGALALLLEMKQAVKWAKEEAKERLQRLDSAACERRQWMESEHRAKKAERESFAMWCEAVGHLSTIAGDCEAWLNSESDEPSVDFIKAVRDYAKKAINNDEHL
jgi:hypothetical protein